MEIRKLEKIHLVRTGDFKKEDYESLIAFIEAICEKENREKIFISYSEKLTIPVSKMKNVKIKMKDVEELIKSPYFSNLYQEKKQKEDLRNSALQKKQNSTSWNILFGLCESFRKKHPEIGANELVIVLTNTTNTEDYFSALDDKTGKNGFVHTDLWDIFLPNYDKIYPITYEIIGLIVASKMGSSYSDLAENLAHRDPPIGCISDFCYNKTEINIKIRTGDICENCIEKIKSHIDFDDVYFILKFLDEIRNETLRTIRYYNINKNVSRIKLIKDSKNKTEIIFIDYDKKLVLKPLHKAIYLYLLLNKDGLATNIEGIDDSQLQTLADIYQNEARGKPNKDNNLAYQTILNQYSKSSLEDEQKIAHSSNSLIKQKADKYKQVELKIYSVIATINATIKDCVKGKQPTDEFKIHIIFDSKIGYNTYKVKLKTSKIQIQEN